MNKEFGIVLIGAGNLATNLGKALHKEGFSIKQVFSRTEKSAKLLAQSVGASYTTVFEDIIIGQQLYIISLRDSAFLEHLPQIMKDKENSLVVHTAGSVSLEILKEYTTRCGVFYPMQTFSKSREVSFSEIPIFIEAEQESDTEFLISIAQQLSTKVYAADSLQRTKLHLAAVFASNFSNHMFALSSKVLAQYGLPLDSMNSLINETCRKAQEVEPFKAQTGPAVRCDYEVMKNHLEMLSDLPELQDIYKQISNSIIKHKLDSE